MRVYLINKYARISGGADTLCLALGEALLARGHDVALLFDVRPRQRLAAWCIVPLAVTSQEQVAHLGIGAGSESHGAALWNRRAYAETVRLIEEFRPDVVNAHKLSPQLSVSPLVAAHRANIPVIQTVHDYEFVSASPYDETGSWWDSDEQLRRFQALNSALFAVKRSAHRRSVNRWIAVSRYVASRLAVRASADVLPNIAPAAREELHTPSVSGRAALAFAGRLSAQKGVDHRYLAAEMLPDVPFRIAGDGPERATVEHSAAIHANVEYLGALADGVSALFEQARVVVIPSTWQEPGALVTLEAMSAGTPLVVYDVGGIAEYVADARAGLVVDQRPQALAEACRLLLSADNDWTTYARRSTRCRRLALLRRSVLHIFRADSCRGHRHPPVGMARTRMPSILSEAWDVPTSARHTNGLQQPSPHVGQRRLGGGERYAGTRARSLGRTTIPALSRSINRAARFPEELTQGTRRRAHSCERTFDGTEIAPASGSSKVRRTSAAPSTSGRSSLKANGRTSMPTSPRRTPSSRTASAPAPSETTTTRTRS